MTLFYILAGVDVGVILLLIYIFWLLFREERDISPLIDLHLHVLRGRMNDLERRIEDIERQLQNR